MTSLLSDVRYGVRNWAKRPGFTAVAMITIALGVGSTAAIFSVVNGVLLAPLPVSDPDDLVAVNVISTRGYEISLSIPNFRDWKERNRTFESFAANAGRSYTMTGGDRPEILSGRIILGDFFETLGVSPALGRTIPSEETWAGAEPVVVITDGFWERGFQRDPDVLGRSITLDNQPFTIVGVMPRDFVFPTATTDLFLPMGYFSDNMCWEVRDCSQGTWAVARLGEGVAIETAQQDLDRIVREITEEEGDEPASPVLESLTQAYVGDIRVHVWTLMGAVSFVLLIACANVAGLLLARGEARRREIAVRTALGAGRGRMIRQLLTEAMVLALAGGLLGIGVAFLGVRLMQPWVSENVPSILAGRIGLEPGVLLFTLGVTTVAGLVFGIVPALRTSRTDLSHQLKEGGRDTGDRGRQRLRSLLVAAEVGLSLVLLIGAGLMMKSLHKLQSVDKGFQADSVVTARVPLPAVTFDEKEKVWAFYERFLERVGTLPGVQSASIANFVPLGGNSWERGIWPEGVPIDRETGESVLFHMISKDHFDTYGIALIKGRGFRQSDRDGGDLVAIVDHTMAERFWPDEDPIGKRVTLESEDHDDDEATDEIRIWRTVVGVARSVRHYELENPSRVQVYIPVTQSGTSWSRSMSVAVKTEGDPTRLTESIRRELQAIDPDIPLDRVETMDNYVDSAMSSTKVVSGLLMIFSCLALALAAIGVFGVMSFSVMQRVREIGIHMALGARGVDVLKMVVRQGLLITLSGVVAGLLAAFGLTRLMTSLLYQVEPVDPVTYAMLSMVLLGVSMLAAYIPARSATRVDPMIVLRDQ